MKSFAGIVLSLALLSGFFCAPCAWADPQVITLSGRAEIRYAASKQWLPVSKGIAVTPGAAVRVEGKGKLVIGDEASKITLNNDTQLHYEGSAPVTAGESRPPENRSVPLYSLPAGKVNVEVKPGNPLDLLTPLIVTAVRGTRFNATVDADGSSRINVTRGSVFVRDKLNRERTLKAGQSHFVSAVEYGKAMQGDPSQANTPQEVSNPRKTGE